MPKKVSGQGEGPNIPNREILFWKPSSSFVLREITPVRPFRFGVICAQNFSGRLECLHSSPSKKARRLLTKMSEFLRRHEKVLCGLAGGGEEIIECYSHKLLSLLFFFFLPCSGAGASEKNIVINLHSHILSDHFWYYGKNGTTSIYLIPSFKHSVVARNYARGCLPLFSLQVVKLGFRSCGCFTQLSDRLLVLTLLFRCWTSARTGVMLTFLLLAW